MIKQIFVILSMIITLSSYAGTSAVTWQSSEKFADIYPSIENKHTFKDELFKVFDNHFQKLAAQLPEQYALQVNITNLDLAGAISFANSHKIRVVNNSTPPRIKFRFQVTDKSNKILVSRGVYLWSKHFKFQRSLKVNKPYYHELALIDNWFYGTFSPSLVKN